MIRERHRMTRVNASQLSATHKQNNVKHTQRQWLIQRRDDEDHVPSSHTQPKMT